MLLQFVVLHSLLIYLHGQTAMATGLAPGLACTSDSQCARFTSCCGFPHGYCSGCCEDTDCPTADICIVQENLLPALKYRTCFPQRILPNGSPCWRDKMCQSGFCSGGNQLDWIVDKGVCAAPLIGSVAPGGACVNSAQCINTYCCGGFCSDCCNDPDCPTGNICIVQANLQPALNYRTCFPARILPDETPCWRGQMCVSGVCSGGAQIDWKVVKGVCGDGWIIIQSRGQFPLFPKDYFSAKRWTDYKIGFGIKGQEYWRGLENIYQLTRSKSYKLRIVVEPFDGTAKTALYDNFRLTENVKYTLEVSGFSGDAGDALLYASGSPFSTVDNDNDNGIGNCAELYLGAWWYTYCHASNLNAYNYGNVEPTPYASGIVWYPVTQYFKSLARVEMAIKAN